MSVLVTCLVVDAQHTSSMVVFIYFSPVLVRGAVAAFIFGNKPSC